MGLARIHVKMNSNDITKMIICPEYLEVINLGFH
jgi:hypothetical protein